LQREAVLSLLLTHVGELDALDGLSYARRVKDLKITSLKSSAASLAFDFDVSRQQSYFYTHSWSIAFTEH
jgi:hypothetical protein